MADPLDQDVLPHGEKIVERFGGIRPMATKLNVPVTTVQGWKKRDAIPANRRDDIISAAALHNINLKGLIAAPANQNKGYQAVSPTHTNIMEDPALLNTIEPGTRPEVSASAQTMQQQPKKAAAVDHDFVDLAAVRKAAAKTSLFTSAGILVIALCVGGALFYPELRIVAGKTSDLSEVNARLAALETNQPNNDALQSLRTQISDLAQAVGATSTGGGATLSQRLSNLEQQLGAGTSGSSVPALVGRMDTMSQNIAGQTEIQTAINELRSTLSGLNTKVTSLESVLQQARTDHDALGRTLQDVSGRDVGAAAMLLALVQLRTATDRQAPLDQDLGMLRALATTADPELATAIDRLSPYASSPIMNPQALSAELGALSTEIIAAKLQGQDISVMDRIIARIQGLFSIKKNGVAVAGSSEKAIVTQAQTQFGTGDVRGGLATLEQLSGPAAAVAAPLKNSAQAYLAMQSVDAALVQNLLGRLQNTPVQQQPVSTTAPAPTGPMLTAPTLEPSAATPIIIQQ